MKEKIKSILKNVNKPSAYIGQEVGSFNKDWDTAEVKTAVAFPDLYEIGISNLGLRILYDKINKYQKRNFLADRVYAPGIDFKKELEENNIPLYGVESFKPLNDFDMIAFSLQYELSYPTILAMFEMSDIPIKSADRTEKHPIIAAGGPGSYNPEPVSEFIDIFIIGDGESVINELLEEIYSAKKQNLSREETLKKLTKLSGVYVPRFYKSDGFSRPIPISEEFPAVINKRIDDIDNKDYPVMFPIPYGSAVHDRAVTEIRRGCGRMCRFCQPCFVNFPVRERSPEHIIDIIDEMLKNTGYDEYSLLSLSSNDYKNIEKLVGILNEKHAKTGVSVSLPSQRADTFSQELAEQVQSVRKSTITFAPEAGSQRLRNVINKNLTEEQILHAIMSVYKTGWGKVKLYFMIGLPTETYEDLDAIIDLLKTIKSNADKIKRECGLRKFLSITCSVSIFVPKPFTPFQWTGQDKLKVIEEKIAYLKQKARPLRDVKFNVHDSFLSLLEAVFSRGGRNLNKLIEESYKNGSYLDAWNEHFNKALWLKSAESLGINLEDYACRELSPDEELPRDMINVGVDKLWLENEYEKALNSLTSVPCDETCSDCGVCGNFNTAPSLMSKKFDNHSMPSEKSVKQTDGCLKPNANNSDNIHRYRMKIQKLNDLKYISHLDWQKLIYASVRKAGLKVNFSQGFNPSPKISLALALPIFIESRAEYVDIELQENPTVDELKERLNKFLPENSEILTIVKISKQNISLDKAVYWAKYTAVPTNIEKIKIISLKSIVKNCLLEENILTDKNSKKGLKKINIRPAIHTLKVDEKNGQYKLEFILKTGQGYINSRELRIDSKDAPNDLNPGQGCICARNTQIDNSAGSSPEGDAVFSEGDVAFPKGDTVSSEGDVAFPEGNTVSSEGDTAFSEGDTVSSEGNTAFPEKDKVPETKNTVACKTLTNVNTCAKDASIDIQKEQTCPALRADKFLEYLTPDIKWHIVREKLLDYELKELF